MTKADQEFRLYCVTRIACALIMSGMNPFEKVAKFTPPEDVNERAELVAIISLKIYSALEQGGRG